MDTKFWLLLLIIVIAGLIGGSILFFKWYAGFRVNVSARIKDTRNQLFHCWDDLWTIHRKYLEKYSDQDAGLYGRRSREFQVKFKQAQDSIRASMDEQKKIYQGIPRQETTHGKYRLGDIGSLRKWWQANQKINQLQGTIDRHKDQIRQVGRSLEALDEIPIETVTLARKVRDLCRETADLLGYLSGQEGMGGKTMEDSLQLLDETEKDLDRIPIIFYEATADELTSLPDVKSEIDKALQILEPAWDRLYALNQQTNEWQVTVQKLRETAGALEKQVSETDVIFNRLKGHLVLPGEQEKISLLCQKAAQVKADLDELTVENLGRTHDEAQLTLDEYGLLNRSLNEYEVRLQKYQALHAEINKQQQAVETTMKATSTRQEYPLVWNNSQTVLEEILKSLASIPPFSERRTPDELAKNAKTAEVCDESLVKLKATTDKVVADLDRLSQLWVQLRAAYTREWLAGVEQLFSEVKKYDMKSNWESADQASALERDAGELLKRASENIPSAASTPIDEQDVGARLLVAKDLSEKKHPFDARKVRIETRLRQMQEEEKEALDLHTRIAPVVILFAREIRSVNVPTQHARNMLAANAKRVELEKALGQRDQGNVSRKLEDVRAWERSTAENGAMVYRWFEDDLLKRRLSISASLREMETFAADLNDEIVVKAHQYDLVFAPNSMDTELLKKQSLDAIQEDAVRLFGEWQKVMECQGELRKFITPLRDEYDRMLSALKELHESCSQLETRLDRDWPVVFQTAKPLRGSVENLTKAIEGSRTLRWNRSDLQRNYYYLWQTLRELGSETDNIRGRDEQDLAEMQTLEKEYLNSVREYARRVYAGNEAVIRREISAGDTYLKSLAEQYKSGRKNGTNIPSAQETKALLRRKIESYKQQLADYNIARMDDNLFERKRQFMPTGKEIPAPLNKSEFINTLLRLIMDLEKITGQHPDIDEAIEDLRSAHREALKNRPDSSELKLFLKSAKGTLVDVEKSVPEAAPVIDALSMLTGVIKNIFG